MVKIVTVARVEPTAIGTVSLMRRRPTGTPGQFTAEGGGGQRVMGESTVEWGRHLHGKHGTRKLDVSGDICLLLYTKWSCFIRSMIIYLDQFQLVFEWVSMMQLCLVTLYSLHALVTSHTAAIIRLCLLLFPVSNGTHSLEKISYAVQPTRSGVYSQGHLVTRMRTRIFVSCNASAKHGIKGNRICGKLPAKL